jgi:hypothetical protein
MVKQIDRRTRKATRREEKSLSPRELSTEPLKLCMHIDLWKWSFPFSSFYVHSHGNMIDGSKKKHKRLEKFAWQKKKKGKNLLGK